MARTLLATIILALSAAPAAAQWEGKWGAIAYGAPEQAFGIAVDYRTAEEARQAALGNCGGRCSRSVAFVRTCAAVAENQAGGWGWASNRWRDRAVARALAQCRQTGPACAVLAWACTSH